MLKYCLIETRTRAGLVNLVRLAIILILDVFDNLFLVIHAIVVLNRCIVQIVPPKGDLARYSITDSYAPSEFSAWELVRSKSMVLRSRFCFQGMLCITVGSLMRQMMAASAMSVEHARQFKVGNVDKIFWCVMPVRHILGFAFLSAHDSIQCILKKFA